ncbi:ATP-binding protein [Nocardia donostiensis]|uniref:ATP-binding protein n=1 Tax=Nocardia donostiensis TaxID=1538463 RepID=UPI0009D98135|nr:ATP-binding protein [Nocardia donostiensis]
MRDAARSGRKRWALSNWDLRWKVTAVLAVPLAVAVGLGVSRISSQWSEANRLADAAENVSYIPTITGLSAATSTVAGSAVIAVAPGRSLVTDDNLAALDKSISDAESIVGELSDVPEAQAAVDEMIELAKGVRANGKALSTLPATEAAAQIDVHRSAGVRAVEAVAAQVSNPSIDADKLRLVDSLNARANLLGEVVGLADILRDPSAGIQSYLIAANTERTILNVLAQRYPDNDPDIASLRQGIDHRLQVLTGPQAQSGQLPLGELRSSVLDDLATYEKMVSESTAAIDGGVQSLADSALADAIIYSIVVLLTILAALVLAVFVARSMIVPLHLLRLAALRVAESDLPHEVAQLRNGASPEQVPLEPMPIRSEEEIGQLARAVDDIHGQALRLASDQAQMRSQVNDMFETLARRSKSLVDHQLSLIEAMEYDEKDPRLLENLFRLDHLAARMRRNGDNLLILAGTKQRRAKSAPVEIADVLRAAISEVEDYERVKLGATPRGALKEPAASDLAHLFAELLDNALRASPPETDVKFTFAQAHDQGLLIEVADRGIGMPPTEMAEINRKLESTAEPGPDTARHMGLFVVGRLAERHGLTVRLRPTFDTARDPGVTVTVHVPVGLIVAGQATIMPVTAASGPQPVVPSPHAAAQQKRQQPAAAQQQPTQSMQTRGISRTPTGNMMVTVDPGVSGPIPAGSGGQAPGGLPQRQPGSAMASGLRGEDDQSATSLRAASGKQTNMPQRGKLAAAALPKRNLAPGGTPPQQRQPGSAAGTPPAAGQLPRDGKPGGLPQRQPGGSGAPAPNTNGLPQRQPGANGAPHREPDTARGRETGSGTSAPAASRETGLPQRAPGATGFSETPQRPQGPSGLPQREPGTGGVPARESGTGGLPARESGTGGLPAREPRAGGPSPRETGGLPQRDSAPSAGNSLPQRGPRTGGLPQRDPGTTGSGLPQRTPSSGGLPQREPSSGLPQRDPATSGSPERDTSGGLPQRDSGPASDRDLPQRGTRPGLPSRESGDNGLPQREPSSGGLPQREPSSGGLPQRGPSSGGLPQRDLGTTGSGLPQREPADSGLPQREPTSGGLPQREPTGSGLPQRESSNGLPQRGGSDTSRSSGLPQRDPSSGGLPQREPTGSGLPQRESSNGLPQRGGSDTSRSSGLPQRDPSSGGLPQRASGGLPQRGPGGLPQREPGALGLGPRIENAPGVGLPQRETSAPAARSEGAGAGQSEGGTSREPGRHSARSGTAKTASFFQTRLQPATESSGVMGGTPIFAEMMSAWLSDPNSDRSQAAASFESPGDEGWIAARRASEAESETRTAAGLPQRNPGGRLVPGAVNGAVDRAPSRDPEAIRSSLSRHQQGVRDGRAMRAMNLTGDKGDR